DSFDRRKLMLLAQSGMAVCATLLGFLALHGIKTPWPIYTLAALTSAFSAFDLPARQSLVPSLVPKEDLPNAFSLNATMFQAASIAGPAATGFVIAHLGLHWTYWLNAISFLAIIAALLAMKPKPATNNGTKVNVSIAAAIEGLKFVRRMPLIIS